MESYNSTILKVADPSLPSLFRKFYDMDYNVPIFRLNIYVGLSFLNNTAYYLVTVNVDKEK